MPSKRKRGDRDGLSKRKDSPYWWVSFTDARGQRTRQSAGTADRKQAEALLAKLKLGAYRQTHWDEKPERRFEELLLVYLSASQGHKRSADKDRQRARTLLKFFTGYRVNDWKASDGRAYVDWRLSNKVKGSTINRELSLLSTAIKYVNSELDWDIPNIAIGRRQREPEGRVRWITRAQAAALIEAARAETRVPYLADFIVLGLNTGMRIHEMLFDTVAGNTVGLEWSRVDLQQGLIYLQDTHQKNGKVGSIPLNNKARAAILSRARFRAAHCPSSPWVFCTKGGEPVGSLRYSFASACKRAGIADFTPHDLRHTCASWLVQLGVPLVHVMELMRHSDIRTTMRYAHLAPENSRQAVAMLDDPETPFNHLGKPSEIRDKEEVSHVLVTLGKREKSAQKKRVL